MIFNLVKDIVKTAFQFEMDKNAQIDKLIYDPLMCDYFQENNINITDDLADLLRKTEFPPFINTDITTIKKMLDYLPFNSKLIFDYNCGNILIPLKQ